MVFVLGPLSLVLARILLREFNENSRNLIKFLMPYLITNHPALPSTIAQSVNHLPAMQETQVRFLGWEDPLKKEIATHSSIFAWETLWTEKPGWLESIGSQELDTT